jgi:hypothetical protein
MVAVEGGFALGIGPHRFDLSAEGELIAEANAAPMSEMRVWQIDGQETQFMGICSPEDHQILYARSSRGGNGRLNWPVSGAGTMTIGLRAGIGDGELHFPISFDVGPDGRVYVLDAANSRIQVFSADGIYITQWGSRGSEPGQFDFGFLQGDETWKELSGSIAVDDEGFIYVADVGNQRIQKFAP